MVCWCDLSRLHYNVISTETGFGLRKCYNLQEWMCLKASVRSSDDLTKSETLYPTKLWCTSSVTTQNSFMLYVVIGKVLGGVKLTRFKLLSNIPKLYLHEQLSAIQRMLSKKKPFVCVHRVVSSIQWYQKHRIVRERSERQWEASYDCRVFYFLLHLWVWQI